MSRKTVTHLFTEWEDPNDNEKRYYHIYAHTRVEGLHTLQHDFYLCKLKISKENIPLNIDFMDMENRSPEFIEKVCPICREILEKRFPKVKAPPK